MNTKHTLEALEALEWMLDAYSQDDPSVHESEVGKAAAAAIAKATGEDAP